MAISNLEVEVKQDERAFDNRYAVYIPDCINLRMIDQLAIELGASDYKLTKTEKGAKYLTAEKFEKLALPIKRAWDFDTVDIYPSVIEGNETQLIHIDHWLFQYVCYIKKIN